MGGGGAGAGAWLLRGGVVDSMSSDALNTRWQQTLRILLWFQAVAIAPAADSAIAIPARVVCISEDILI